MTRWTLLATPMFMLAAGLGGGDRDTRPTVAAAPNKKVELQAAGWASLKGTVTFEGDVVLNDIPNKNKNLRERMAAHKDAKCCLDASAQEIVDQVWLINKKNKGLANVLVWLKPPEGTYFPIHKDDRVRKDTVTIAQPHCAFMPHMAGLYPVYFDGHKHVKTGQKLEIKNDAPAVHNVRASGDPLVNPSFNVTMPPGQKQAFALLPQKLPLALHCDIHPWMTGWIGVFDHPYFAVTTEAGTYAMPRVPTGVDVSFIAWHEAIGYIYGKEGKQLRMQKGFNQFNFKVVAK